MAVDVIQCQYEQLDSITARFQALHDRQTQLSMLLRQCYEQLRNDWTGDAAVAFFAEMDASIFPAIKRLQITLTTASALTTQISQIFRQAEAEAAKGITFEGEIFAKAAGASGFSVQPSSNTTGSGLSFGQTTTISNPTPSPTPNPTPTPSPTPNLTDEQQAILAKVQAMIHGSRLLGYTMAHNHLEHWLAGSGEPIIYPAEEFMFLAEVRSGLSFGFYLFKSDIEAKIATGEIPLGLSTQEWDLGFTFSTSSEPDKFYAIGSMNMHYEAEIEVIETAEGQKIIFHSITTHLYDTYDWDVGKQTNIPFIGTISDDDMKKLELPDGFAQSFEIMTEPWQETEATLMGEVPIESLYAPEG